MKTQRETDEVGRARQGTAKKYAREKGEKGAIFAHTIL